MNYFLPDGYKENTETNQYIDNDDGVEWQFGAYNLAMDLSPGHCSIVDIGCGGGRKLRKFFMKGFPIIGYDCNKVSHNDWMDYRSIDLEKDDLKKTMSDIRNPSLVICADVVEHLRNPEFLMKTLIALAEDGNTVIITTPNRTSCHGAEHNGPPPNIAHAREWSEEEFLKFVQSFISNDSLWSDRYLTQTTNRSQDKHTTTIVLRKK